MTAMSSELSLARFDAARVAVLEWKQPRRGRRDWELVADGATVATLVWRGPWRGGWIGNTAEGSWRIRHGFFGRLDVSREDTGAPVADARRRGFRSVEIRRTEAEALRWRRTGFFRSEHRLENVRASRWSPSSCGVGCSAAKGRSSWRKPAAPCPTSSPSCSSRGH